MGSSSYSSYSSYSSSSSLDEYKCYCDLRGNDIDYTFDDYIRTACKTDLDTTVDPCTAYDLSSSSSAYSGSVRILPVYGSSASSASSDSSSVVTVEPVPESASF